jgi:hypothetical protein
MFFPKQYYGLIAGLREWTLDGADKGFDANAIYGEIRRELSHRDKVAARLLWALNDIYGLPRPRIEWLYGRCAASPSKYLREWGRFDRNLRNVIAAHTARGKGVNIADSLVGTDEITLSLSRSTAADFNLKGELEYIDTLLTALGDVANIVEKERAIDLIRWDKSNALAEFDSFGMPTVLSYLVKVGIIRRWAALDPVVGREMYERLVGEMTAQVKI